MVTLQEFVELYDVQAHIVWEGPLEDSEPGSIPDIRKRLALTQVFLTWPSKQ